jgi:hypothetical protein
MSDLGSTKGSVSTGTSTDPRTGSGSTRIVKFSDKYPTSELQKTVNVCTNLVRGLDKVRGAPLKKLRNHIIETQDQWDHDTAVERLRGEMGSVMVKRKE